VGVQNHDLLSAPTALEVRESFAFCSVVGSSCRIGPWRRHDYLGLRWVHRRHVGSACGAVAASRSWCPGVAAAGASLQARVASRSWSPRKKNKPPRVSTADKGVYFTSVVWYFAYGLSINTIA